MARKSRAQLYTESSTTSNQQMGRDQERALSAALRRLERELRVKPSARNLAHEPFRDRAAERDIRQRILAPHREQLLAAITCARHVHGRAIQCTYVAPFRNIHPWMRELLIALREEEAMRIVREETVRLYPRDVDVYDREAFEVGIRVWLLQIHADMLLLALRLNEIDQRNLMRERDELKASLAPATN